MLKTNENLVKEIGISRDYLKMLNSETNPRQMAFGSNCHMRIENFKIPL